MDISQDTSNQQNIGQHVNISISGRYVGANILAKKYRLGEYIGIGWTNIGPTVVAAIQLTCDKIVLYRKTCFLTNVIVVN
jgi:hypothetical protein